MSCVINDLDWWSGRKTMPCPLTIERNHCIGWDWPACGESLIFKSCSTDCQDFRYFANVWWIFIVRNIFHATKQIYNHHIYLITQINLKFLKINKQINLCCYADSVEHSIDAVLFSFLCIQFAFLLVSYRLRCCTFAL